MKRLTHTITAAHKKDHIEGKGFLAQWTKERCGLKYTGKKDVSAYRQAN